MMYYFAYGSNMDRQQMRNRCPDAMLVEKAVLKNYTLAFTIFSPTRECGCADVIQSSGDEVWGLVYAITPDDLQKLDTCEGHPVHYKRFTVSVTDESGKSIQAETYEVVDKKSEYQKPSRDYLGKIISAADSFRFPAKYKEYILQFKTKD